MNNPTAYQRRHGCPGTVHKTADEARAELEAAGFAYSPEQDRWMHRDGREAELRLPGGGGKRAGWAIAYF
jgi:hypothetical protein